MGFNADCIDQNCQYNCCDYSKYCPPSASGCYYYYHEKSMIDTIVGATVGAVVGLIVIIINRYCCKKRKELKMQEEIRLQNLNRQYQPNAGTTTIIVPGYGQGHQGNNVYGQPINPGFGQPVYQQPYYAQPSIGQQFTASQQID